MDWTPLVLSVLAGLSTSLGASVAFCTSKERPMSKQALAFSLSLAGSVMITVSVVSLLPESFLVQSTHEFLSLQSADFWKRITGLIAGCVVYWLLNKAFPEPDVILGLNDEVEEEDQVTPELLLPLRAYTIQEDADVDSKSESPSRQSSRSSPHPRDDNIRIRAKETNTLSFDVGESNTNRALTVAYSPREGKKSISFWKNFSQGHDLSNLEARRSWRVAMLLFVSLVVHNFPEGVAVGATAMHSPKLGLTTTVAIALHNIPEGIAIAVPCLAARPDAPWLAFGLASASGIAEPMGAAFAMFLLARNDSETAEAIPMGIVLAFVAGVMVMVAAMELFPEALRHSKGGSKLPAFRGLVTGAVIMVGSDAYIDAAM
jgi:ZIP family zinc transporter